MMADGPRRVGSGSMSPENREDQHCFAAHSAEPAKGPPWALSSRNGAIVPSVFQESLGTGQGRGMNGQDEPFQLYPSPVFQS